MRTLSLSCWRCGVRIEGLPKPVPRAELCPHCNADLHVCRQCEYFAPDKASACAEPIADHVQDKTRANFCGYFEARTGPAADDGAPTAAQPAELKALFGLDENGSGAGGDGSERSELDRLFGLDSDGES